MTAKRIALVLLSITIVTCEILPGPCPKVPPTGYNYDDLSDINIFYPMVVIPTDRKNPSFLFVDSNNYYRSVVFSKEPENKINLEMAFVIRRAAEEIHVSSGGKAVLDHKRKSIQLTSMVEYEYPVYPVGCHTPITEDIHIWYENFTFVIWSCIDDPRNSKSHDEAVILGSMAKAKIPDYIDKVQLVKMVAEKYLSTDILKLIKWPEEEPNERESDYNPYECLAKENQKWILIVCVGVALVLIVFIINYFCLHKSTVAALNVK